MAIPVVVGFDLDMTLVDARDGIAATYRALAARTGRYIDADAAIARLGPPLRDELANWFPPEQIEDAVHAYRSLYPEYANQWCRRMPGAVAALAAVRERGGRIIVVTSKLGRFARAHLDRLGMVTDEVVGDRFGDGKRAALTAYHVEVYVGDHVADARAARAAGAVAVGVATGPCPPGELAAAGADPVLVDLRDFPAWFAAWMDRPVAPEEATAGSG